MFPSFKSLSDREEKRLELLERSKRYVAQRDKKREMYASASWAGSQSIAQTSDKASQKKDSPTTMTAIETRRPPPIITELPPPPPPREIPSPIEPRIDSPAEIPKAAEHTAETRETPERINELNHQAVIGLFKQFPYLAFKAIKPISMKTGHVIGSHKLGEEAKVLTYRGNSDHKLSDDQIDWKTTYENVAKMIRDNEKHRRDVQMESESKMRQYGDSVNALATLFAIYKRSMMGDDTKHIFSRGVPIILENGQSSIIKNGIHFNDSGSLIRNGLELAQNEVEEILKYIDGHSSISQAEGMLNGPNRTESMDTSPPVSPDRIERFDQSRVKDSEMRDMTGSNVSTYMDASMDKKKGMDNEARAILETLISNNSAHLEGFKPMVYNRINERFTGYHLKLSSIQVHDRKESILQAVDRKERPNNSITEQVSWMLTLLHMLDKLVEYKKFTELDLDGVPIWTMLEPKRVRAANTSPKTPRKKVRGRGLVGAGGQPVFKRGSKVYNLNDIRGTSIKSAITYQPLGSKYIKMPDLDDKTLNIVYPSRVRVGPKRKISDALQAMIKDLVHDGKISQDAYDHLSFDEKRVFREILNATHIQHSFKDKLADPIDTLKAEFDKLRGEISLGNDNPSIIKQLRVVAVDMYRHKLISDDDFKKLMVL